MESKTLAEIEERVARAICRAWLKPDPKDEPAYTNQRWPLFREEARAAMASRLTDAADE